MQHRDSIVSPSPCQQILGRDKPPVQLSHNYEGQESLKKQSSDMLPREMEDIIKDLSEHIVEYKTIHFYV